MNHVFCCYYSTVVKLHFLLCHCQVLHWMVAQIPRPLSHFIRCLRCIPILSTCRGQFCQTPGVLKVAEFCNWSSLVNVFSMAFFLVYQTSDFFFQTQISLESTKQLGLLSMLVLPWVKNIISTLDDSKKSGISY